MTLYRGIRSLLKTTPAYSLALRFRQTKQISNWRKSGRPSPPPPAIKQRIVADYARQFGLSTLIETGTFNGDMLDATKRVFTQLYSIEIDPELASRARKRLNRIPNITIIDGNSGLVLPELLGRINDRCLFWLDGHYSGPGTGRGEEETPVSAELRAILRHQCRSHVVLIDDARFFTGLNGYPPLNAIKYMVANSRPEWMFELQYDIIRLFPR